MPYLEIKNSHQFKLENLSWKPKFANLLILDFYLLENRSINQSINLVFNQSINLVSSATQSVVFGLSNPSKLIKHSTYWQTQVLACKNESTLGAGVQGVEKEFEAKQEEH